jgi:phosphatidylserine/phosphatidylglycerophosphate/cardiolipin synthase-like enzyme
MKKSAGWIIIGFFAVLLFCGCGDGAGWDEGVYEEGAQVLGPSGKADDFGADVPAYAPLPEGIDLDKPFQVVFAPLEPVVTLELWWIDWVRQARRWDPGEYQEGANPYRIRYAVYTLRNQKIMEALADAEDEGVDVQILIESDQLGKERDWMTVDEYLAGRGFEVVLDHHDLDEDSRTSADLIGIKHYGLTHVKTRIFQIPVETVVLSGSFNAGSHAPLNDENFHIIRDPALVSRYASMYEHLVRGERPVNKWDDDAAVNVLFTRPTSGQRPGEVFLRWLQEENEQILLMAYSMRDITARGSDKSLVQILSEKHAAGVPVYVISDRKQSDGGDYDDTEDRLRAAGVPFYEARNDVTVYTAMHHKVAVLGLTRIRVVTDSANWTRSGLGTDRNIARNQESMLFIDSNELDEGRTGRRYLAEWLKVLSRYAHQSQEIDGEGSFEFVRDCLLAQAEWPRQSVLFRAFDAQTEDGEQVHVVGDHPDLDEWGDRGSGVALETTSEDYPEWWSAAPVYLPVAVPFEWKLATFDPAGELLRFEAEPRRISVAYPPGLLPGDGLELNGTWR